MPLQSRLCHRTRRISDPSPAIRTSPLLRCHLRSATIAEHNSSQQLPIDTKMNHQSSPDAAERASLTLVIPSGSAAKNLLFASAIPEPRNSALPPTPCLQRYMPFVTVEPLPEFHDNRREDTLSTGDGVDRRILILCLLVTAAVSQSAARDLALVSNKANALTAITLPDLIKVCKAQIVRWPDGRPVTFIMRAPSSPEMKMLLQKIFELPDSQVTTLINTANHGRTNHPAILIADSDEDLVNKVASIPGALGVVDVYAINSSVAVIKLAGKLPLEPGYLLHGD